MQTDDGVITGMTPAALGSLERPLGWAEIEAKFKAVAEPVYGRSTSRLFDMLRTFDERGRLDEIGRFIAGHAAAA